MRRESLIFSILRLLVLSLFLVFMVMTYWSSLLLEEDLKEIKQELAKIQESIEEIERMPSASFPPSAQETLPLETLFKGRAQIDPSLPNLLSEDLFYQETLPKLLGPSYRPKGVRKMAMLSKPEDLHPFSNMSSISTLIGYCVPQLSTLHIGKFQTMAPELAIKIEERVNGGGKPEFWVHLRDQVFWQPLRQEDFSELTLDSHFLKPHQVTAEDFKFYLDVIMNPHFFESGAVALRNYFSDVEEIRVVDPLTFVIRWKTKVLEDGTERMKFSARSLTGSLKPLPRFVYQYFPDGTKIVEEDAQATYRTHAVFAQQFSRHFAKHIIVSCGPWIFAGMTERSIAFDRNPDYFDPMAALNEKMEIVFRETTEAMWQDFKAGSLDTYGIRPNKLGELKDFLGDPVYIKQKEKGWSIHRLDYVDSAYHYVGWNTKHPLFRSKKIRQAMTLAIDRGRIIDQYLSGMGIKTSGPFLTNSPSYNQNLEPYPFDPVRAKTLLQEEGWFDSDDDGILDKEIDGQIVPFSFKLSYYVKNPDTKAHCEYIRTALKQIGVNCELNGIDIPDLTSSFEDKSFDAIYFGWALPGPPENPRQLWHSDGAAIKGSSNAVSFSSSEADQIIDALEYEYDEEKRKQLYWRFHAIIYDEAPYTFIFIPKTTLLFRDYVHGVFIPKERQDLVPGADIAQPDSRVFWVDPLQKEGPLAEGDQ